MKARILPTNSGIILIGTYMPVMNPDNVYTKVDIPEYALLVLAMLVIKNRNAVVEMHSAQ